MKPTPESVEKAKHKQQTVRVSLEIPMPPNFLRVSGGGSVRVGDLDDAMLRAIAKNWAALLLLKARNQRKVKS